MYKVKIDEIKHTQIEEIRNNYCEIEEFMRNQVNSDVPLSEYGKIITEYKEKTEEVKNKITELYQIKNKETVY